MDEHTSEAHVAHEKSAAAAWAVAGFATLGMSVSYVDRQTLAAIAPSVTKALAIDNAHYGWLLSAFSMAYLVGAPLAGIVVDRLGARRGFVAALVVWSAISGAHALATSFGALFALRIWLGLAEAPSFPSAAQAVQRALPGARRPLAFGLLFTGSSIGAIVAAKLALRLESAYGFRGAFAGTALVGMLWIPAWLWVTRGFGLDHPVSAARSAHRSSASREWFGVVTSPPVLRAIVCIVGSAPAMMFVLNWTSKYLVDAWKLPKDGIGDYLIAAPLLFDVGAVGFGYVASARVERARGATQWGLFLFAMALTSSLALASFSSSPEAAIAICAATACGCGGLFALVTADMLARVPAHRTSSAGGMAAAAQSLAYVVASPLVGWTVDRTHGYGTALVGLGLVVIPTTLAFLAWPGMARPAAAASNTKNAIR